MSFVCYNKSTFELCRLTEYPLNMCHRRALQVLYKKFNNYQSVIIIMCVCVCVCKTSLGCLPQHTFSVGISWDKDYPNGYQQLPFGRYDSYQSPSMFYNSHPPPAPPGYYATPSYDEQLMEEGSAVVNSIAFSDKTIRAAFVRKVSAFSHLYICMVFVICVVHVYRFSVY